MIGHATLARPRRFCASANWRDPGSIAQAGAAKAPRHVLVTFTDEAVRSDTALNGAALSEPACGKALKATGAVPGLNRNNVYRLPVVIPPPSVLSAFDDLAASLRARVYGNDVQAQTLTTLRDTLLPRLISGQLRLPQSEVLSG